MKQTRRIWTIALCSMLAALFILSGVLLVTHAGHDCTGADCPVCAVISASRRILRSLISTALLGGVAQIIVRRVRCVLDAWADAGCVRTLVALKVKLSD